MGVTPAMTGLSGLSGMVGGFSPGRLEDILQFALAGGEPYEASTIDGLPMLRSLEPYGTYRQPRQGRAWLFDGVDDFANRGARLTSGSPTALTVSAWVKPTSFASEGTIAGEWDGNNNNRSSLIRFTSGGAFLVAVNNTGLGADNYIATTTPTVTLNQWVHVSFTYSPSGVVVYINGSIAAVTTSGSIPSSLFNTSASFVLGVNSLSSVTQRLQGRIRDVRVYNVAKTAPEIAAIFAGNDDTTGLLAWYPCNEESGTVGYDISGNGNHLTLTNITQSTFHATDTAVTSNRNNSDGYRLSGSVYIPKRLSDNLAADGNALTATGRSPYPANVEVPCITGDGSTVYVDTGSPLIPATADFEISLWYFHPFAGANAIRTIIDQRDSLNAGLVAVIANSSTTFSNSANKLVLALGASAFTVFQSSVDMIPDTWNHIAVRRVGNDFELRLNQVTVGTGTRSFSVSQSQNFGILVSRVGASLSSYGNGRVTDFRITTAGVTKYFPLQGGPGSSNTNRDVHWVADDGTYGVVANAITNGTVSTIWANRCPNAEDWCVNHGGKLAANGSFVPGNITGNLAADGNEKTLSAGKFGNPYSRINFNPFTAAELNGLGTETAYARGLERQSVAPINTKFRRTATTGDDRFFTTGTALTGANLSSAEKFVTVQDDPTAYQILVKTNNAGTSSSTQFTLPATGTYDVDWGDGIVETKTGAATHTYPVAGNYVIKVTGGLTSIAFNNGGDRLKLLEIQNWGDVVWSSFNGAYWGCSNCLFTATDSLVLPADCASSFRQCTAFNQSVSSWNTSAVTSMFAMFTNCSVFNQSVSNFNTSLVTNMGSMFSGCANFNQPVENFDTASVTLMTFMFNATTAIKQSFANFSLASLGASAMTNFAITTNINTTSTTTNYDATLIAWAAQLPLSFAQSPNFGTAQYSAGEAATARAALVTAGWTIADGGQY
jgi:surface protein